MIDKGQHAACVEAWLKVAAADQSAEALLRLFELALGALWARALTTLGEVTLAAIAERVVHNAAEQLPLFSTLQVDAVSGIQCHALRQQLGRVSVAELREGVQYVLVEFLKVIGNLTAEILTEELHAELARTALPAEQVAADEGEPASLLLPGDPKARAKDQIS